MSSNDFDSRYVEVDGKLVEREDYFEGKILTKITKQSEKYPILTGDEEQIYLKQYQERRDALYAEAQRVYGVERYPAPTSWESDQERGVIRAIITPGSPHYSEEARVAREKMVLHNLRLLKKFGKARKRGDLGEVDIYFAALDGLYRAVEKFDRTRVNKAGKPLKFSTYAVWWLKFFAARESVNKARTIRIPIHVHDQIAKLGKIYAQMSAENFDRHSPTSDELSKASGMPIDLVKTLGLYAADFSLTSLDRETFSDDEDSTTLLDGISNDGPLPEEVAEQSLNSEALHRLIDNSLAPEDAKFAKLYYGLVDGSPRNVREMSSALGVPRKEVSDRVDRIMLALQKSANREEFSFE